MDLQAIFTEAIDLHARGDFSAAKAKYLDILNELPGNVNVLGNLGIVCRDLMQMQEAYKYCRQAVDGAPHDPNQHINLGAICEAMADLVQAKNCYETALQMQPTHPKALNNLGKIHHMQGNQDEAIAHIEKALAADPNYPIALNNIGVILSERGEYESALRYLEKSFKLDPQNHDTLYNLAGLYNCLDQKEKATSSLTTLLSLDPEHAPAQHMLSALAGKTTDAAPAEYVVDTFDRYANRFDAHLTQSLGYDAPYVLAKMVSEVKTQDRFSACLDLGCGTGLSGEAFQDHVASLTGVDVSSKMLAKAEQKGIYNELVCQEINSFFQQNSAEFDLFIVADVLVYIGRLEDIFENIARFSKKKAMLACSIEHYDGSEDFILRSSGRYAQRPDYLKRIAANNGYMIVQHKEHGIRKENNSWIPGDLYVLQKKV